MIIVKNEILRIRLHKTRLDMGTSFPPIKTKKSIKKLLAFFILLQLDTEDFLSGVKTLVELYLHRFYSSERDRA